MGFEDVAFLPSRVSFPQYLIKIVVEVTASGPPHVLKLSLGERNGMLPVEYACSNKASFLCQLNFMEIMRLPQS